MIDSLLSKIAMQLDKEKIPYMLIGGQAVLLYGTPRLTRDIDITLGIDSDQAALVEKICRRLKLNILPKDVERFVQETKVLPAAASVNAVRGHASKGRHRLSDIIRTR